MKPTIAVAISGGIDSLMAAQLLKEEGYRVTGIHFVTGYESGGCLPQIDRKQARERVEPIADQLGIEIKVQDIGKEFQTEVVEYFTQAYQLGQTPNPCLRCNPLIKFGSVLVFSRSLGADQLATGHYAQISTDSDGIHHLKKGVDLKKDQSYFLAFLTQDQLRRACFPLGRLTKERVRLLAGKKGLAPAVESESQDVCFIPSGGYGAFLAGQPGFQAQPGIIEDVEGNVLGGHAGLHLFTIGQRRGINCPAAEPYYVVRLDRQRNRLIVGNKDALRCGGCRVKKVNWITGRPSAAFKGHVRLRYRHTPVPCQVHPEPGGGATVRFATPQVSVTPGQGAVFYDGEEVVGGGWIASSGGWPRREVE